MGRMRRRGLSLILAAAVLLGSVATAGAEAVPEETVQPTVAETTVATEETVPTESTEETIPEESAGETLPTESEEETLPEESTGETIPEESTEETIPEEILRVAEGPAAAVESGRFGSGESPLPATAENSVATLGSGSGIRFRIFNYTNGKDAFGNYINAGGINDNGLDGWFNFRGTSYENTAADGTQVSNFTNSVTDVDGYTANHATVLPNLGPDGYPVFDGSRGGGPQKSLGYLFGAGGKGVTGYAPSNTPLRRSASGQYYYNSADNAADFDIAGNRFIVRTYRERGKTTADMGKGQYYDFFPFTYWDGTTRGNTAAGNWYNYNNTEEVDYWYGMTMEAAFSMPAGGLVQGEQMVFSFSGDDDVWVFIDGVLVLDLGGTHGVVSGSINFATGEVKQYLDWNSTGEGSSGTSRPTTLKARFAAAGKEPSGGWNGDLFANYTEHTIKFYYLERATSCANCKIRFNMPILPTGELTVEKEVEGAQTALTAAEAYGFVLLGQSGAAAGVPFDRLARDGTVLETGQTDAQGGFVLKAGQRVRFHLTAGKTYRVLEEASGAYAEAVRCSVNGVVQPLPAETEDIVMDPETPAQVRFVNALKTTSLTIRKEVAGNLGDRDLLFAFRVRAYTDQPGNGSFLPLPFGDGYAVQDGEAVLSLKHGQSATVTGIPVGAWVVVTEDLDAEYETQWIVADTSASGRTAQLPPLTEPGQVLFINTREGTIDTGVRLDAAPYLWMTASGALLLPGRKRKRHE